MTKRGQHPRDRIATVRFDSATFARASEAKIRTDSRTTPNIADVLNAVPVRLTPGDDAGWFDLDGPTRTLFETIDQRRSVHELAVLLGMSDHEAVTRVFELISLRLVTFRN